MKAMMRRLTLSIALATAFILTGCAGIAPVPGGSDSVNESYYKEKEDFLRRVDGLMPGMPQPLVMQRLGRREGDFQKLERDEIVNALLGTNNIELRDGFEGRNTAFIQSLYGYKLNYKVVDRRHGFSSPISIRTEEHGFAYNVVLIFQNGRLFEKPVVSGGIVNASSSRTIFDYLNPGNLVDRFR